MPNPQLDVASYRVGILCALSHERAAVEAALDEEHEWPKDYDEDDGNVYSFGKIGEHNVVIASLPEGKMGKAAAASVGKDASRSFPLKVRLLVGIGGGVPSKQNDIRLGDVVISQPSGDHGGVIQWDFGKAELDGFRRTSTLNKPPRDLLSALSALKARHENSKRSKVADHLAKITEELGERYGYQGAENDNLFPPDYAHVGGSEPCNTTNPFRRCDVRKHVERSERSNLALPRMHYGNIASGDEVVKNGLERDRIASGLGALCFEMEAAGLEDSFPCLVIRGICDYSDSHKNKDWQRYAAATAAAFAKEFLSFVRVQNADEPSSKQRGSVARVDGSSSYTGSNVSGSGRAHFGHVFNFGTPPSYLVPFSISEMPVTGSFIPRQVEMSQIEAYFEKQQTAALRRKVFIVHGMGGIGKTQICVEFARRNHKGFSAVFWLDGSSKKTLQQSIIRAAGRVKGMIVLSERGIARAAHQARGPSIDVDEASQQFLSWLSESQNTNWLMIIDNLDREVRTGDDEAYDYHDYLPSADHGNVLITTRLANLQIANASLQVERVNLEQARAIVESHAHAALSDADELLATLDGLPLALAQAGSYLGRTRKSIAKYLQDYDRVWTRLMQAQSRYSPAEYGERSILTTWSLSYEQIAIESPPAAGLLRLWAYFDHHDVSCDLLAFDHGELDFKPPDWFLELTQDDLALEDALAILADFSMISVAPDGQSFSMHAVVHRWNQNEIESREERIRLFSLSLAAVAILSMRRFSSTAHTNGDDLESEARLIPHARHQANYYQAGCGQKAAIHLKTIAYLLRDWALWSEAQFMLEEVVSILEPKHEQSAYAIDSLGFIARRKGLYAEAEQKHQQAVDIIASAKGEMHADTLELLASVAASKLDLARRSDANQMYFHILEGLQALPSGAFQSKATIYVDVAQWLYEQCMEADHRSAAIVLLRKILWAKQETHVFGPESYLRTNESLAELLSKEKYDDLDEAEDRSRDIISALSTLEGLEELRIAAYSKLDWINYRRRNFGEARTFGVMALKKAETLHGEESVRLVPLLNRHGQVLLRLKDYDQAEEAFDRMSRIVALDSEEPDLNCLYGQACCYIGQHRIRDADRTFAMYQHVHFKYTGYRSDRWRRDMKDWLSFRTSHDVFHDNDDVGHDNMQWCTLSRHHERNGDFPMQPQTRFVDILISEPMIKTHIDTMVLPKASWKSPDRDDFVQDYGSTAGSDLESGSIEDGGSLDNFLIEQYRQSAAEMSGDTQFLYRVYRYTIDGESLRHFNIPGQSNKDDPNFINILCTIPETMFESLRTHTNELRLRHVAHDNGRSPVYPKIHLDYIELATLRYYDLPWEYDQNDSNYIIILRDMEKRETDILFEHSARLRNSKLLLEDDKEHTSASPKVGSIRYGESPIHSSEPGELSEEQRGGNATIDSDVHDDDEGHHIPTSRSQPGGERSNSISKPFPYNRPESENIRLVTIKSKAFLRKKIPQGKTGLVPFNNLLKRVYREGRMTYGRRHSVGTGIWQNYQAAEVQYWSDPEITLTESESESETEDV